MNLKRKLLAETYATALLTFVIMATNLNASLVGLAFWMCIQGTNMIHAFHFNPVVQIASIIHKRGVHHLSQNDKRYLMWSIIAQIIGAIVGTFVGWWIYDSKFYYKPGADYSNSQRFFAELFFSIHFVLVSLGFTYWSDNKLIGDLAVSGALTAGILTVGHISGACFNPTICITINIIQGLREEGKSEYFEYLWIYFVAPLLGCLIAAGLSCIIHTPPVEVKAALSPRPTGSESDFHDVPHVDVHDIDTLHSTDHPRTTKKA